jgi:1,4-dihydroxy-2-naphthoate octaprenyltransferase
MHYSNKNLVILQFFDFIFSIFIPKMEKLATVAIQFSLHDIKSVLQNFRVWIKNSRPIALPQSILPAITAVTMAYAAADFNIFLAIAGILGVMFGHLGSNLFDDYFDYTKKASDFREQLAHTGIRARIAKCSYLTSGQNTVAQLLAASVIFSAIALFIGSIIWFFRGNEILYFAVIAAFFGLSYSGFPFKFSYHGLGEFVIGLMFGPLLMSGVYLAACGSFSPAILFISIPIGLLVTNIVYSHAILDYEPDKLVNKRTLAVLLNNKKGMLVISFLCNFIPFIIVTVGVICNHLSYNYLSVFITFPMAINLFYLMIQFYKNPHKEDFTPKFWMGPMEKWEQKVKFGIGWFMIRWMLARNLLSFFCIIIAIISIINNLL